eukprot:3763776-Alexandrium_andersonii.AAC.1
MATRAGPTLVGDAGADLHRRDSLQGSFFSLGAPGCKAAACQAFPLGPGWTRCFSQRHAFQTYLVRSSLR